VAAAGRREVLGTGELKRRAILPHALFDLSCSGIFSFLLAVGKAEGGTVTPGIGASKSSRDQELYPTPSLT
jgi:hypothetical protein